MRLDIRALTFAIAILWGGALFLAALINLLTGEYAGALLELVASIYPGYEGPDGFGSVLLITLYGLIDGALGGFLTAWLYNVARGRAAAPASGA